MGSSISKFHQKTITERQHWMKEFASLTHEEERLYAHFGALGEDLAERLIENTIGVMEIPLGLAVNFLVNERDVVVPMAVEESSVVAAASYGAKLTRQSGGFNVTLTGSLMFSQIQLVGCKDPHGAKFRIISHKQEIIDLANQQDPILVELGGGAYDIDVRVINDHHHTFVVVHLYVNTIDAMGANAANTMAEKVAHFIEKISGGEVYLRIISNLADKRLARAACIIKKKDLGGEEVVDRIVTAYQFAKLDPYRAVTHNKGIMNGISTVVLATGNDTRAIEAGAHAYASRTGKYTSLSTWEKNEHGDLVGTLEMPLAVGIVGGYTSLHPKAKANLKLMKVHTAADLAEIIVAVGLAQNLTALKALATDGIQKGHMKLHAKNIAIMAGAIGDEIDAIAQEMVERKTVRLDLAKELLNSIKKL